MFGVSINSGEDHTLDGTGNGVGTRPEKRVVRCLHLNCFADMLKEDPLSTLTESEVMMPALSTVTLFLLAALGLLLIPGPSVLYILTRSAAQGRRAGLASVGGIELASLTHAVAATLGLSALLLLTTVYTRAGEELTDPQEGCRLEDIKHKNILRRTAMLRSQTVNTIHDVHAQGKSVQEIAQELNISRTTVRKYLKQ